MPSQLADKTWKVDPQTLTDFYTGSSRDNRSQRYGLGRLGYLHERNKLAPEEKFTYPLLSSWSYGWEVAEEMGHTRYRPKHGRKAQLHESFYAKNEIPMLLNPTKEGGVCATRMG